MLCNFCVESFVYVRLFNMLYFRVTPRAQPRVERPLLRKMFNRVLVLR